LETRVGPPLKRTRPSRSTGDAKKRDTLSQDQKNKEYDVREETSRRTQLVSTGRIRRASEGEKKNKGKGEVTRLQNWDILREKVCVGGVGKKGKRDRDFQIAQKKRQGKGLK